MIPRADLLARIPDTPPWVETRSMLVRGANVHGDPNACVVVKRNGKQLAVVGEPERSVFESALATACSGAEILAAPESEPHVAALTGRPGRRATLHVLPTGWVKEPPSIAPASLALLFPGDRPGLSHVPDPLRTELRDALAEDPLAVAIVDEQPVAFCYPNAITETLWDVAIDTLAPCRRRGLATQTFRRMCDYLSPQELSPVWGAFDDNEASLVLAASLGFEPCAAIYAFSAGGP